MRKSLFHDQFNIRNGKSSFIDKDKLNQVKSDVNKLLEVKKCNICKKDKVIYYFQIDKKKDEYSDVCIECSLESNQKVCEMCKEFKEIKDFYRIRDVGYTDICKKCIQQIVNINTHMKECKRCKKILPASVKYFKIQEHYDGYLESSCRVCRGFNYLKEK